MVRNVTRDATLARQPRIARAPWTRARGMIGRAFEGFDALVIPNCGSVHTWFMGQTLDLLFLDAGDRVLQTRIEARPWRLCFGPAQTRTVIELPPATLRRIPVERGDTVRWEEPTGPEASASG